MGRRGWWWQQRGKGSRGRGRARDFDGWYAGGEYGLATCWVDADGAECERVGGARRRLWPAATGKRAGKINLRKNMVDMVEY